MDLGQTQHSHVLRHSWIGLVQYNNDSISSIEIIWISPEEWVFVKAL